MRRASRTRIVPVAVEGEVADPEFDAAYKENLKDARLGGLDVLFCPQRQPCLAYLAAVFIKFIEYLLIAYCFIVEHQNEDDDKATLLQEIIHFILYMFFCMYVMTACITQVRQNKNMMVFLAEDVRRMLLWLIIEMAEVIGLWLGTLFLVEPYIKAPPDIELILNGVGLMFIAEMDENSMMIFFDYYPRLHYNILKAYYEALDESDKKKFIDPTVRSI